MEVTERQGSQSLYIDLWRPEVWPPNVLPGRAVLTVEETIAWIAFRSVTFKEFKLMPDGVDPATWAADPNRPYVSQENYNWPSPAEYSALFKAHDELIDALVDSRLIALASKIDHKASFDATAMSGANVRMQKPAKEIKSAVFASQGIQILENGWVVFESSPSIASQTILMVATRFRTREVRAIWPESMGRTSRPIARIDLRNWWARYVGKHNAAGTQPTNADIHKAVALAFPERDLPSKASLIALRAEEPTPAEWRKPGRPRKSNRQVD